MRQGVKTLQVRASTVPEVEPIRGEYREDHEADGPNFEGRLQSLPFFALMTLRRLSAHANRSAA
jgi:hypothetical protein